MFWWIESANFPLAKIDTKNVTHIMKKYVTNKFPNAGTKYRINSRKSEPMPT